MLNDVYSYKAIKKMIAGQRFSEIIKNSSLYYELKSFRSTFDSTSSSELKLLLSYIKAEVEDTKNINVVVAFIGIITAALSLNFFSLFPDDNFGLLYKGIILLFLIIGFGWIINRFLKKFRELKLFEHIMEFELSEREQDKKIASKFFRGEN